MSLNGQFSFGEQAAVAATYAVGTNRIVLAQEARSIRVLAKGAGQIVFFVVNSANPASDLADPNKRFKVSAVDPTKTSIEEYDFDLPFAGKTFDFLTASGTAEVYLTGEEVPSCS